MYQSFNELPYGQAYLFKGNTNKLGYLLLDQPNVSQYVGNNLKDLSGAISFELTNFIFHFDHYKVIPDILVLPPTVRVFIVFSIYDSLEDNLKAKYKLYQSKYYIPLDYSKFTVKDCKKLSQQLLNCQHNSKHNLCKLDWGRFAHYPLTIQSLLNEDSRTAKSLRSEQHLIIDYIKELASTKDIKYVHKLANLGDTILKEFTPPFHIFHAIINEGIELKSLTSWYKIFYFSNESIIRLAPNDLVFLFFLWVYRSSVVNNVAYKSGLTKEVKGKQIKYYFRPSNLAVKEFYNSLIV